MTGKRLYDCLRNQRSRIILCMFKLIYGHRLTLSKGVYVRKGFVTIIEDEGKICIGKDVFFNNFCSLNSISGITIGDNCIFGENVHIYDHNHVYSDENIPINKQGFTKGEVCIGENCWIGSNVVILKGVKVGKHCVISANTVIYKDIPANSVIINKQNIKID